MVTQTIFDERILREFRKRNGFNLAPHLVMACYVGSETHGTRDPDKAGIDDIDMFGVIVPPMDSLIGLKEWEHFNFIQDELDVNIFSLKKWVKLLLNNNPNMLGTIWLPEKFYMHTTPAFNRFLENRNIFSSLQAFYSFSGYAQAQLARLHKGEFKGYMGEKRKELVKQFGYDPKMASHLIRLYRMGIEFVQTGVLEVYRHDREELIDIKKGKWPLEKVLAEGDRLSKLMEAAKVTSTLMVEPEYYQANQLLIKTHMEYLTNYRCLDNLLNGD